MAVAKIMFFYRSEIVFIDIRQSFIVLVEVLRGFGNERLVSDCSEQKLGDWLGILDCMHLKMFEPGRTDQTNKQLEYTICFTKALEEFRGTSDLCMSGNNILFIIIICLANKQHGTFPN